MFERESLLRTWSRRAVALSLIFVLWPLMAIIFVTLKSLGQDPFFRQRRVGYQQRMFTILKFRTIPEQGWEKWSASTASEKVAALRAVTGLLRKTGLDELPQLWNIACGDMRFFGPRPLTDEDYLALPKLRVLRCTSLPGITGLAQVNGGQLLDDESKLAIDLLFLSRQGAALRLEILWRSIARLIGYTAATNTIDTAVLNDARRYLHRRKFDVLPRTGVDHRPTFALVEVAEQTKA